jgi:Porin PorA
MTAAAPDPDLRVDESRAAPTRHASGLGGAHQEPSAGSGRGGLVGYLCLALACLCLALAYLLPAQVYPRLAVLPADPKISQVQIAQHATALVPDLSSATGVRLVRDTRLQVTTYASQAPQRGTGRSVVWTLGTRTTVEGHGMINARVETVSLDEHTALPTNCCGDRLVTALDEPRGVALRHEGYVAFPFDVQKHSYPLWDIQLKRARMASYVGEERRDGLRTYVFRTDVPFEKIGSQELPGSLFGVSDPSVNADAEYADSRTFWVEPASGDVIGLHEELNQRYSYQGRSVTAVSASLDSPRLSDARLADDRRGAATFPWLRGRASYVLVPVGLLLLAGWVLTVSDGRFYFSNRA